MKWKTTDSAYLLQAPTGVAGDITRVDESSVEPTLVKIQSADYPVVGMGVKLTSDGTGVQVPAGDAATTFVGVLVREVPGISNSSADDASLSPQTPWTKQVSGLLVRGYAAVICAAGTPVRGGVVYWQVTDNGGVKAGSFRADGTDSANAVALTAAQATWACNGVGPDGSGNTNIAEIRVAR